MKAIALFLFPLLCIVATAQADVAEKLYERGRAEYFSAKKLSAFSVKRQQLLRAASDLKQFLDRFPTHPKITEAYFNLGSIYRDLAKGDNDRDSASRSLHYFRQMVSQNPDHPLADDALFEVASICRTIFNDRDCANEAEEKIRRNYPHGDMVARLGEALAAEPEEKSWSYRVPLTGTHVFQSKSLKADPAKNLPQRYFVDISNAKLTPAMKDSAFSSSDPVTRIRFGQFDAHTIRVVLDLAPQISPSDISVTFDESNLLFQAGKNSASASPTPNETPEVQVSETKPSPIAALSSSPLPTATSTPDEIPALPVEAKTEKKVFRVVVDAGHGGEDIGAKGKKGTLEKDVCLSMAKKLELQLKQNPMYEVFMTRTDDIYIPLAERTRLANSFQGDLFVSIHANASPKRSAQGVSTYFLDNADDKESLRVAMRENAELIPDPKASKTPESEAYYLEIMKASMIKNFHTVQSTDLARYVQNHLVKDLSSRYRNVENLGVRSAHFYVLTGANMPAILVETSFISNPDEEKRLKDANYQGVITDAIERGIEKFFKSARDHSALYNP